MFFFVGGNFISYCTTEIVILGFRSMRTSEVAIVQCGAFDILRFFFSSISKHTVAMEM